MRLLFWIIVGISSIGFGKDALFKAPTDSTTQLNTREAARYDRIKKGSGVLRAKMIAVNEASFSEGMVQLDLFAGARDDFKVTKDEREAVWKGKGRNLDRFVIRKIGGKYTGHILHKGKQYVLIPIKPDVSVLVEQSNAGLKCGSDARLEAAQ